MLARIRDKVNKEKYHYNTDTVYLIMCIYKNGSSKEYELMNDSEFWGTRRLREDEVVIIDDDIPESWETVMRTDETTVTSFPKWAHEEKFINYIFENDYFIEEGKVAWSALQECYGELINYYLTKLGYTTVSSAHETLIKLQLEDDERNAIENGWEQPERIMSESAPLNLNDIYKLWTRKNSGNKRKL